MQQEKFHIHVYKVNAKFWYCKKMPDYFEQGVQQN